METGPLCAHVTLREKVAVAIRCRPTEAPESTQLAWQLQPNLSQVNVHPDVASLPSMQRFAAELDSKNDTRCKGSAAQFDLVFDSSASTRQVYKGAAQRVVLSALDGINGAIMAYGQTGSGKTYTMLGDHMSVGIITMALMDIFTEAHSRGPETKINITATLVELYSERLRDLFAESTGCASDKPITIRVGPRPFTTGSPKACRQLAVAAPFPALCSQCLFQMGSMPRQPSTAARNSSNLCLCSIATPRNCLLVQQCTAALSYIIHGQ
jgi:hypothetical protein